MFERSNTSTRLPHTLPHPTTHPHSQNASSPPLLITPLKPCPQMSDLIITMTYTTPIYIKPYSTPEIHAHTYMRVFSNLLNSTSPYRVGRSLVIDTMKQTFVHTTIATQRPSHTSHRPRSKMLPPIWAPTHNTQMHQEHFLVFIHVSF
jgi:hypothetical protein